MLPSFFSVLSACILHILDGPLGFFVSDDFAQVADAQFSFEYSYLLRVFPVFYLSNKPVLTLYPENCSWCCAVSSQWVNGYPGGRSATMFSSSCSFLAAASLSTSTQAGAFKILPCRSNQRRFLWASILRDAEGFTAFSTLLECQLHPLRHHQHRPLWRGSLSCQTCCSSLAVFADSCCVARRVLALTEFL